MKKEPWRETNSSYDTSCRVTEGKLDVLMCKLTVSRTHTHTQTHIYMHITVHCIFSAVKLLHKTSTTRLFGSPQGVMSVKRSFLSEGNFPQWRFHVVPWLSMSMWQSQNMSLQPFFLLEINLSEPFLSYSLLPISEKIQTEKLRKYKSIKVVT